MSLTAPERIEIARQIAAELPLPTGWPQRGRGWPAAPWITRLRKAGWPTVAVMLKLPQQGHTATGRRREAEDQAVTCVPMPWLIELARRCGLTLPQVCRGRIEDE